MLGTASFLEKKQKQEGMGQPARALAVGLDILHEFQFPRPS